MFYSFCPRYNVPVLSGNVATDSSTLLIPYKVKMFQCILRNLHIEDSYDSASYFLEEKLSVTFQPAISGTHSKKSFTITVAKKKKTVLEKSHIIPTITLLCLSGKVFFYISLKISESFQIIGNFECIFPSIFVIKPVQQEYNWNIFQLCSVFKVRSQGET